MPGVAFFDMDRTLVRKNTAQLYVRYQREMGDATWMDSLRVAYWVAQYTLGIVDADRVAQAAVETLIGKHREALIERCRHWVSRDVEPLIGSKARDTVKRHLDAGDICAIVTASITYAAQPVADALQIPHVIATELEQDDSGHFTGRFVPPLCYGNGKIARSQALAESYGASFADAVFYTDSVSDLPMLERVATPVAVNPDPRLRRIADRRSWRVERW